MRVAVLGAAGGIGQPLSLLLKLQLPSGSTLLLYDLANVKGVAADLSHVDSNVKVEWAQGALPPKPRDPELLKLLKNVDVVVICAGIARKPGMSRDDLFNVNAGIVLDLVTSAASVSNDASYAIITNPVNSTVPIAAEGLKKMGKYNKNKLFGVTTLDVLRATQFINERRNPVIVPSVPVIGGHSGSTIIPLFSQLPGTPIPAQEAAKMFVRVQDAGTEVVNAKAGAGSATLSMAAAGARFALNLVSALRGDSNPIVYTYVDTDGAYGTNLASYFAVPVALGKQGVAARLPIGKLSAEEEKALGTGLKDLKANIEAGIKYAKSKL
eukprot:PhF_6_TR13271/c0_g1_i1/m.21035/K00024/mdh; malate dehydrogenase